jgi:hypothetical protein
MKCAHPMCGRGIGLVSHRRWFAKRLYCSRACRHNYAGERRAPPARRALDPGFLAWLLALPNAQPTQIPQVVRAKAQSAKFR